MKKILLSFLALIAMVGMVNAQRAWAYDLQLTSAESSYTFAFKAMTAGTATLVFTDAVGAEVGTVDLGAVEAGANTKTLALAEIPGAGNLNWAVKMTGAAIEEVTEVTAAEDKYYYYLAQDLAANTNPESKHFGKMYVLETYAGAGDGKSAHSQTQTPGIYVYDPALNLENYAEGYLPSNVTLNTAAAGKLYRELHRMAINPVKEELAFVQSTAVKVWVASLDNLEAEATNVLAETGIKASSLCYDENGTLYVLDPFAATATIYKQVDGEFVKFVERDNWGWTDDRNAMESDGRGGLWVVQNISNLATNSHSEDMLTHINAEGEVDFFVNKTSSEELQALMPDASNRGQIGYDAKHDVLAFGGSGTVRLFHVTYTEEGPTLSLWQTVTLGGNNVDGLAFDYAGDLIAMSASVERFYKFALPTAENTCTTPAPKAQVVVKEVATPTYTVTVSDNTGGFEPLTTGGGEYEEGENATVTASEVVEGWVFVGWMANEEFVANDLTYTFAVEGNTELVAIYAQVMEEEITNLVIDPELGALIGGPSTNYEVDVYLVLGEDEGDGEFLLSDESSVSIMGQDATWIDGMASVDMDANVATAIVVVEWNGSFFAFTLAMSAAPAEPIEVVVENATVTLSEYAVSETESAYELTMVANWTYEKDGLTYEVECLLPTFDPTNESGNYAANFYVRGAGAAFGMAEGANVLVTVENQTLKLTGEISAFNGNVYNVTISGTLPADEPEVPTALDNVDTTVAPVKAIVDGQLVIVKDGVKYNAQGAVVK